MKHIGKMRVGELRCRQSENKSKFQVITISQSTEIVDITLQIMIVGRCVNWAVKQNVVCDKRHSSIRQGDHGDAIDINNEQQRLKDRALRNSRVNRQDVR